MRSPRQQIPTSPCKVECKAEDAFHNIVLNAVAFSETQLLLLLPLYQPYLIDMVDAFTVLWLM